MRTAPIKLTLRDLFWLVLVVAMGCGWWMDKVLSDRERVARMSFLESLLLTEGYRFECDMVIEPK